MACHGTKLKWAQIVQLMYIMDALYPALGAGLKKQETSPE